VHRPKAAPLPTDAGVWVPDTSARHGAGGFETCGGGITAPATAHAEKEKLKIIFRRRLRFMGERGFGRNLFYSGF